jgi:hypothetical protein
MSVEVACIDCGGAVRVRDQDGRAPVRCARCASLLPRPRSAWERGDELPLADGPEPARAAPAGVVKERQGRPAGGCPECGGRLRPGDVLCVECGYDVRLGRRRGTRVRRYRRSWRTGLPLAVVLAVLLLSVVFGAVGLACLLSGGKPGVVLGVLLLAGAASSAAVYGWSGTVRLERDRDGRLFVTVRRRWAGVPLGQRCRDVARYRAVVIDAVVSNPDPDEVPHLWLFLVLLPLFFTPVGPVFFRAYFVRERYRSTTARYRVWLQGRRAGDDLTLYRGHSDGLMRELVEAFAEAGGLEIKR